MNFYIKPTYLASNLVSFAISGLSGLAANVIIVRLYNTDILGLFNQILAIYFIVSQLAVFGIHQSVLAYITNSKNQITVLISGILTVLIISTFVTSSLFFALRYIFDLLKLLDLKDAMYFVAPALIFFSLNKVMIAASNGQGYLNIFATANCMRLVLLICSIFIHYYFSLPVSQIAATIVFSEIVVFCFLVLVYKNYFAYFKKVKNKEIVYWTKKHLSFGRYSVFSGMIVELNTKIDIIILTLFVERSVTGVYSFATMLGEGFYLLISVFKNLNSKNLSLQLFDDQRRGNFQTNTNYKKYIIYFICLVGIISICLYKPFAIIVTSSETIKNNGFWVYLIYATTLMISAKYLLIDNILILAKKPKIDSYIRLLSLSINIGLCLLLVPFWGEFGAIIALSTSMITNSLFLRYLIKFYNLTMSD